jgi:hypothetical protein
MIPRVNAMKIVERRSTTLQWQGTDYAVRMSANWLCPHCTQPLRPSAVRPIGFSSFDLVCEACHRDTLRIERL